LQADAVDYIVPDLHIRVHGVIREIYKTELRDLTQFIDRQHIYLVYCISFTLIAPVLTIFDPVAFDSIDSGGTFLIIR